MDIEDNLSLLLALCLKILIATKQQISSKSVKSPTIKSHDPNETIDEEDHENDDDDDDDRDNEILAIQTSNKRLRIDEGTGGSALASPSVRRSRVEYSQKFLFEQLERQLSMRNSKLHQQMIQAKCLTWLKIAEKLIDSGIEGRSHPIVSFQV